MSEKPMHILIIGGVAAGAACAARARRLNESAKITILERGPDVSFANCGLPYFIGDEIKDRSKLNVQTPESLKQMLNVEVRTLTEAVSIDRSAKQVVVRRQDTGENETLPYDKLVLAPGAAPIRPALPGVDDSRIMTLRNLIDMDRIKERITTSDHVLVVGAGFIGLEMAENLVFQGKKVTLVEMMPQVLPQLDPDMTRLIEEELRDHGVDLILGDGIASFDTSNEASLTATLQSGKSIRADSVVLSIGVKPESKLAADAELQLGIRGAIVTNEFQQTSDPDIYAAGDAVETADRVFPDKRTVIPLGGPANRQGRLIADHIFATDQAKPYPGTMGTSIVRVFNVAAGITGWSETRLRREGIAYRKATVADFHHANYYPGAQPLTLKILWDKETGRILGGQATGREGVDKRLDVLATAIINKMDAEDLADLELAYAPPFGSARDIINTAGFNAANINKELVDVIFELPDDPAVQIVDVRPPVMFEKEPLERAVNIPFGAIRSRMGELDKSRPVVTFCAMGKTSYFAARILIQNGFNVKTLAGGMRVLRNSNLLPGYTPPKRGA